jgi:Holliday junction resolvasome RuvABC ATP-dependent DNA helicase subunit
VIAKDFNILISPQAAGLVAKVSHGLPRIAEQYLDNLRLWFPDSESQQLSISQVNEFLRECGVDEHGLREEHHRYLRYLGELDTVALGSMAILLGTDPAFVRHQIEHPLLLQRFIVISKHGRQLSHAGRTFLDALTPSRNTGEEDIHGNNQGR